MQLSEDIKSNKKVEINARSNSGVTHTKTNLQKMIIK